MGQDRHRRILVLVIILSITSFLVHAPPSSKPPREKAPLVDWLMDIKHWKSGEHIPLDPEIVKALDLDDYVNQYYFNGRASIFLYVGYYLTTKKLGAPHSPLVCFHGAGWSISEKKERSISIQGNRLNFMTAIVTKGRERQLLLYWFPAYDKSFPGTFFQKLYAFWVKWVYGREDNAFVRVSLPLLGDSSETEMRTGTAFLYALYPSFVQYIKAT